MRTSTKYLILLLLLTVKASSLAQNISVSSSQQVENAAIELGLKNIAVKAEQKQLVLAYENTRYRFESLAITELINKIGPLVHTKFDQLLLIAQKQGIPVFHITIDLSDFQAVQDQEISMEACIEQWQISYPAPQADKSSAALELKEKGFFRAEFVLEPQLRLSFGSEPEIVAHQINLLPRLDLHLWKGALFQLQYILPISDELEIPEETFIRPGRISFHQVARLPGQLFGRLSLGYFSNYRYGGELELGRFFLNGRLFTHASLARTGYASYPIRLKVEEPKAGWEFSDISSWQYRLGLSYWVGAWDLSVRLDHERVPFGQSRNRIVVERYFNETKIGFFAYRSGDRENYGITLSIPIPPSKYFRHKRLQLRPSRTLEYQYHGTQFFVSGFDTGHDLERFFDKLNPQYLKRQLARLSTINN